MHCCVLGAGGRGGGRAAAGGGRVQCAPWRYEGRTSDEGHGPEGAPAAIARPTDRLIDLDRLFDRPTEHRRARRMGGGRGVFGAGVASARSMRCWVWVLSAACVVRVCSTHERSTCACTQAYRLTSSLARGHTSKHTRTHARTHTHTHTRRAYMHEQDSVVGEDMRWSRLRFCLRLEKGRADVMVMEMAIGTVVGGAD